MKRTSLAVAEPMSPARAEVPSTAGAVLVELLARLGVRQFFGVLGGSVAPFSHAIDRSPIDLIHCRHESAAAFAATEAYFASGRPSGVVTIGGPGLTNALTGMVAAKWEGAKVVVVSGATPSTSSGRVAFQETSAYALPLLEPSAMSSAVNLAASIDDAAALAAIAAQLEVGFERPGGFVAHLRFPTDVQKREMPALETGARRKRASLPCCTEAAAADFADAFARAPFGIWVGFGARHAAAQILELVERTGAGVVCSQRAKGIFPETHPRFAGVTGFGGHDSVRRYLTDGQPERMLVLGSRLAELTTFFDLSLVPPGGLVRVDLEPDASGVPYPNASVETVQSDVGLFLDAVLRHLPKRRGPVPKPHAPLGTPSGSVPRVELRATTPVRARVLMEVIQREIVDGSDAVVLAEAGNAVAWTAHHLRFGTPGRYRVSMRWGSMGHAVAGVVGAALGRRGKAVAIVGDGAMLMNSEVSTAVEHRIPAVWIVLNDARYGMVEQGLRALGMSHQPNATSIPRCDFVQIAQGMGARGLRVEREVDIEGALVEAMAAEGPVVVDVLVDPAEIAPAGARFRSLADQWDPKKGINS